VHHEWHDQVKQNNGFNIAMINETLLQSIHWEVMDKAQADSLNEVSLIFKPFMIFTNHCLFSFPL
jgi:hypothetical protein